MRHDKLSENTASSPGCRCLSALRLQVLGRDAWRCLRCGATTNLEVHHLQFKSRQGDDAAQNLITLCSGLPPLVFGPRRGYACHARVSNKLSHVLVAVNDWAEVNSIGGSVSLQGLDFPQASASARR